MFYIDENLLDDSRALITIQPTKRDINKYIKAGMINYTTADNKLWLTSSDIRENIDNPLVSDMFDRIITAVNGVQIEDSFQFMDDQTFMKNVTIKRDLLIEGNLSVLGKSTVIDTPHLSIEDNIIEINKNEKGNGVTLKKAGVAINRGSAGFARFIYDDVSNSFVLDKATTIDGDRTYTPIQIFLEDSGSYKAGDTKLTHKLYTPYADVDNTLNVKAIANIKTLNVSTTTNLNGTLVVGATALFNNTLNVKGISTLDGAVNINGVFTASNVATFNRTVAIKQTLKVTGITTLDNTLDISTGGINLLAGNAVFHDDLEVKDNARVLKNLNITGATSVGGTLTVNSRATIEDILSRSNVSMSSGNGHGLRFWDSNDYKIYMSETAEKVTGASTSDYNMYFKMTGGTNRGHVFLNGSTPLMQIEGNGTLRVKENIYSKESLVLTKAMEGSGNGIDADTVDGKHAIDLVLRDGTQSMLGNLKMDIHKIMWKDNDTLSFEDACTIDGVSKAGLFKFIADDNIANTVLETGMFKAGTTVIDGATNSISNLKLLKSATGKLIEVNNKTININGDNAYDTINFANALLRADGGINIGVGGNILKADSDSLEYKGEKVLTTAGTSVMNGDINMATQKLRFSANVLGLSNDSKFAEIYATHEDHTELNIVTGKSNADKIIFKNINTEGTEKDLITIEKDIVTFADVPYHGLERLLTSADIGSGNGLDADTVDGKHYLDLVEDFINTKGDTMTGDLLYEGNSKVKFSDESNIIYKDTNLNIKSDEDILLTAGSKTVSINKDGTLSIGENRVLTIADEGHENLLDSDTVDNIHANQFVRRDETSTMESDINMADNKVIFTDANIKGTEEELNIEKSIGQATTKLSLINKGFDLTVSEDGLNYDPLLKVIDTEVKYKEHGMWHEGNLTPALYEKIAPIILEDNTDMNTITNTGRYICNLLSGVHTLVNNKGGYIEVIQESEQNILQKISTLCSKFIIQRTLNDGEWTPWIIVAGKQNHTVEVSIEEWREELDMHYIDITHDLVYSGIASVMLVDAEGFSMFTGFKEVNSSTIKIYSANRIAGKVAINISLN